MPFTVTDRTNPYTGKPLGLVQWGAPLAEDHFVFAIREGGQWRWSEPVSRLIDGHALPFASEHLMHFSIDSPTREVIRADARRFFKTRYFKFLQYMDALDELGAWKPQGE
jgi:hypothetical protein